MDDKQKIEVPLGVLRAAFHALSSYGFGNAAPALAHATAGALAAYVPQGPEYQIRATSHIVPTEPDILKQLIAALVAAPRDGDRHVEFVQAVTTALHAARATLRLREMLLQELGLSAALIAASERVMAVYAAPEFDDLGQDGQVWVRAIIIETIERCQRQIGQRQLDIMGLVYQLAGSQPPKHYGTGTEEPAWTVDVFELERLIIKTNREIAQKERGAADCYGHDDATPFRRHPETGR